MTRKRVLLLVNLKYRDLPGLSLIKVFLERIGPYDVILAPHVSSARERFYLRGGKPDLVVLPHLLNQTDVAQSRRFQQLGIGVAVIPTEGVSLLEEFRLNLAGKFVDTSPIDLFFVWNKATADLVRTHKTVAPERYVMAGVPRFDFYHPRFRRLIKSKETLCAKYGMNPEYPIVTWATDFGFVWLAGKPAETAMAIRHYKTDYALADHPTFGDVPTLIERDIESRKLHTETVLKIAREFPKANIVIKVHPAEERKWYQDQVAQEGLHNVRVTSQEYIWDVLNATDVHLHRSCTTAVEAWFLNKPTVDLQFAPREWLFSKDIAPGGDVAFSSEECLRRVRHYLTGGTIPPEQQSARPAIIEGLFGEIDGQSSLRYADAIHTWLKGSNSDRKPKVPRWTPEDLRFTLTSQIKSLFGLQPHHSLRAWLRGDGEDTREKYFKPEDAQFWTDGIKQLLNEEKFK